MRVRAFTPVVFGRGEIANFTIESYPRPAAYYVAIFATLVLGVAAWHLIAGRRRAARAEAAVAAG